MTANIPMMSAPIGLTNYELSFITGGDDVGFGSLAGGVGGIAAGGGVIAAGSGAAPYVGAAVAGEVVAAGLLVTTGGLLLGCFGVGWLIGEEINSWIY